MTLAVGAPLKETHLHIIVVIGGPFRRGLLTHCSCYTGGLFEIRVPTITVDILGVLFKAE